MTPYAPAKPPPQMPGRARRILVIDDTRSIHDDFKSTLTPPQVDASLAAEAASLFDDEPPAASHNASLPCSIDSAFQGKDGCAKVEQALQQGNPYAVAFVDMRMPPGWDGLKTIERLWEIDPKLQVVICSAYSDYSWDDIVNRLGISDQLLLLKKPFDTSEVNQIAVALTQKWKLAQQAETSLAELQGMVDRQTRELREMAYRDRLTGLPNRAGLLEQLSPLVGPSGIPFGLFFLDFDRFKMVNDSLGHDRGDELLIKISRRIEAFLDDQDTPSGAPAPFAARLGGDEFLMVWPGRSEQGWLENAAQSLVDRLRPMHSLGRHLVTSTASIGVTTSQAGYTNVDDAIRDADVAMYRAKQSGKDQACFFTAQMHDDAVERLQLEDGLARALALGELSLNYQPIIHAENGETVGYEALIRWNRPATGFVSPEHFIAIAEETGQIIEIGKWVADTAIRQLAQWRRRPGCEDLWVSINFSKRQMLDPMIGTTLDALIREHGVPAASVHLEITETTIIGNSHEISTVLTQLRERGFGLAMDDFGKGHSSLNCLNQFPITTLKIDRLFIENMAIHRSYSAIIQAVVVLAKNLGVRVVAEGVETRDQLVQLQALDCDLLQGYYFSKPLPPETIFND